MIKRLLAIIRKEFHHILRDPRTLAVLFIMPVVMVLLYGYALTMDITGIPLAVSDRDRSPGSREFIRAFTGSKYFVVIEYLTDASRIEELFQIQAIRAAIVIPHGFGASFGTESKVDVQLLVDGSDPTYGQAIVNYANAIAASFPLARPVAVGLFPVQIREQFLFNPDLRSSHFIIPGLVAIILMMICALLTSITLAREKETGTLDMLVVSPVRSFEIVFGKVVPYVGLALLDSVLVLAFARFVFNIPMRGDLLLLLGLTVIYIYCALGLGLFISSIAPTQQVAMMAALVATIMPSMMLSGFLFPIFSMPTPIRFITNIVPAKYYLEIIRGILLKSSGFAALKDEALILALIGTLLTVLASLRFKTRTQR